MVIESIDLMQQSIELIHVNSLEEKQNTYIYFNINLIYLFPEVMNQVYFLPNPNVVIFLIDPMTAEFSIIHLKQMITTIDLLLLIDYST